MAGNRGDVKRQVLAVLENGNANVDRIMQATGLSRRQVLNALQYLVAAGVVARQPLTYSIHQSLTKVATKHCGLQPENA